MDNKVKDIDESAIRQFVSFNLDGETHGLDIMMVESIERISSITPVPKTPDYILGVTNIRGEIIPIVNIRRRLGMEDKEYDGETRIIISKFNSYRIGLIVDKVNDVISVSGARIKEGEDIFKDRKNDLISMIIEVGQDYLLVLDLVKVLNLGE